MAVGTAVGLSVLPPLQARPTTAVMARVVAKTRIFLTSNPPLVFTGTVAVQERSQCIPSICPAPSVLEFTTMAIADQHDKVLGHTS